MGILVRAPDGNDPSMFNNWVQASYIHASLKPPNPAYPTAANPQCHSNGQCQDGDWWPDCSTGRDTDGPWGYATALLMYATKYQLNERSQHYKGNGQQGKDNVYTPTLYFSDSNALDEKARNGKDNFGRGCHASQNFGCTGQGADLKCITWSGKGTDDCKCDYDGINPRDYGGQTAASLDPNKNPQMSGFWGAPTCGQGSKQPIFQQDYSSCWFEDAALKDDASLLVDAQNSMWSSTLVDAYSWWNRRLPSTTWTGEGYWGWNEAVATGNIDTDAVNMADAIGIVLPAMSGVDNPSLCYLTKWAVDLLENDLLTYWNKGYGHLPVVIMSQVAGTIPQEFCDNYWGGTDCDAGFKKDIFAQNFIFPTGGNCLNTYNDHVYFYPKDDPMCQNWGPSFCP